ncbi:hypothetical protein [Chitinimonas lacunae]
MAVSGNAFTGSSVDLHYSAIQDPSRHATTQSSYIAQQGDTLRRIAQMVWGDGRLWYLIGEENGLHEAEDAITAGTMLKLPRVLNAANDASVFTPHSASEVLGETSPALPAPPPPPKPAKPCGGYGQAIIMVVSAVIAAYTGQWVGGLLQNTFLGTTGAAIVGAAAGGAMGSIVNQAGNMAIGTQERFSWQAVGQAALRKAVTAGIGQAVGESGSIGAKLLPNAPEFFQDVATGAITGAVTDGLLSLTGLGHFSWRNVAAAAIAEPINKWVGNNLFGTQTTPGSLLARDHHLTANFTHQLANGLVNRVAQIATHGEGRLDWVSLVGNAFGETLGNEVAGKSRAYQVGTQAPGAVNPELAAIARQLKEIEQSGINRDARVHALVDGLNASRINAASQQGRDLAPTQANALMLGLYGVTDYNGKPTAYRRAAGWGAGNQYEDFTLDGVSISSGEHDYLSRQWSNGTVGYFNARVEMPYHFEGSIRAMTPYESLLMNPRVKGAVDFGRGALEAIRLLGTWRSMQWMGINI